MIAGAASLAIALEGIFGPGVRERSCKRVSGGDINDAALLETSSGDQVFLKENRGDLEAMFAAEAQGLLALAAVAEAPPVPRPLAWGREGRRAFLLMSVVPSDNSRCDGRRFGRALAALHRDGRSNASGFSGDNWIGSTPQPNPRSDHWLDFFAEHRLGHQWAMARRRGYGDRDSEGAFQRLLVKLPDLLPDVDQGQPSLLHGDLWGGNWMTGLQGEAWLIDPATYYGHREADLAMTELFGGFPPGFRSAYEESWPLEPGFSQRRDLYNLYHMLNHLNLFGASYWGSVTSILRSFQ